MDPNSPPHYDFAQATSDGFFGGLNIPRANMASPGPPGFDIPIYTHSQFLEGSSTPYHGLSGHDSSTSEAPETPSSTANSEKDKTSWVWPYFELVKVAPRPGKNEERFEATCLLCRINKITKKFQWVSGTGTFVRHLARDHQMAYNKDTKKIVQGDTSGVQTQLGGFMSSQPGGGMPFVYTHQSNVEGIARFTIVDEQPFSFGESAAFEKYQKKHVNPQWNKVPRNTLKRGAEKQYFVSRGNLIEMFGQYKGRVSLTCDCWKSPQYDSYICITAHWCDNNYNIQKRIIAFDMMDESHSAVNIYNKIRQTLIEFNLESKLFSISFDNASPNTAAIPFIKENMVLLLNGQLVHVRCCAHILNLCVQDGLCHMYDIVEPIRKVINWFRRNSTISRKFKDFCKKNDLKKKKFSMDNKIRWNSTYLMLCEAIRYKDAITSIYNEEMIQKANEQRIKPDLWDLVEKVCKLLECFYKSTLVFSYVYESNVHLVIMECYKIVAAMDECFGISTHLDNVVESMRHKWLNYLEVFPHIYGIAAMLDPAVKRDGLITILDAYYESLHIDYDVNKYVDECYSILLQLYDLYNAEMHPEQSLAASRPPKSGRFGSTISNLLIKSKRSATTSSSGRTILESYFNTDEYLNDDEEFVILKYWRGKATHWPILTAIARDILVIPASTVASESAFSSGRRIVSDYRTSLTSQSVKICVCLRDWERADERTQDMQSDEEKELELNPWLTYTPTESSSGASGTET